MTRRIRWGVLGAANIATEKVIPAMQQCEHAEVVAIASRDLARAEAAAARLGIARAHGSYEALLADPEIDAIYNPLPNHLHVPWSIRAAEAGKHVLCEKPVALDTAQARTLRDARDRTGVLVGEAFMARSAPQWVRTAELVRHGAIGQLRAVVGAFSYFNADPGNVRNMADIGGGALYDVGCYPITIARLLFAAEPLRVSGAIDRDPGFGTDRLTSALLEFAAGHAIFTCSTQLVPYQRMQVLGTTGRIEVEVPFNALTDRPLRLFVDDGSSVLGDGVRVEEVPTSNQYTVQGDLFSRAILDGGEAPTPIDDAVRNMAVIDAIFRSAASGRLEEPDPDA